MKPFAKLDDDFKDPEAAIETGHLKKLSGDTSVGIVETILKNGLENLSPKQAEVFYEHVINKVVVRSCKICDDEIPWPYMFDALNNGHLCQICSETREQVKKRAEAKNSQAE